MKHYKKGLHSLSLVEAHKSCNSHDKLFDEFNRSQFFHYVCRCGQSKILLCCLNPFPLKTYFCTKTSWVILISVVFMVDSVAPQNQVKSLNIWMSWEMWRLKKMFDRVHFPHLIKWSCVKTKVLNRKLAFIKWKLFSGKI